LDHFRPFLSLGVVLPVVLGLGIFLARCSRQFDVCRMAITLVTTGSSVRIVKSDLVNQAGVTGMLVCPLVIFPV
jgi:hypothetical protein